MHSPFPLVSVIIPFLNEESFLEEAIQSVISQNYSNWELILIDDGSTDKSSTIAKSYALNKDFTIFYVEHPNHINKGLSPSRNLGISKAKGELVAFLDADDIWTNEKLQIQVEILTKYTKAAMVCEASKYWFSWNSEKEDMIKNIGVPGNSLYEPPQLALNLFPLKKGVSPCPSSIMIRRTSLLNIGGFEESFTGIYGLFEDQAFLFKVYLNESIYVSTCCNNLYRQRPGSIIYNSKINKNKQQVRFYYFKWASKYYKQQNNQHPEVNALLKSNLRSYSFLFFKKIWRNLKKIKDPVIIICKI